MKLKTKRLSIVDLRMDMAGDIQKNSLDEDNRQFLPDEVFNTLQEARETLDFLITRYEKNIDPFVYAVILNNNKTLIGHVQAIKIDDGNWEIGYHIAKKYRNKGYATEALQVFIPKIMKDLNINELYGITLKENAPSIKVLEKCGFKKIFTGLNDYLGKKKEIIKYCYTNQY